MCLIKNISSNKGGEWYRPSGKRDIMKKQKRLTTAVTGSLLAMTLLLAACGQAANDAGSSAISAAASSSAEEESASAAGETTAFVTEASASSSAESVSVSEASSSSEEEIASASEVIPESGKDTVIAKAGTYTLRGEASEATVRVHVGETETVELVLDGAIITNSSAPCILVEQAGVVRITTTDSSNSLTVSGTFAEDGTINADAVIYSLSNLVLDGEGMLSISSSAHAVLSEKNIDVKGGSYDFTAVENAFRGCALMTVDDGNFNLVCGEAIEGTVVTINGGDININASDDGINASEKSEDYTPYMEINGGNLTINMAAGDTDALDSNGDLVINGGTLTINAQSPFDYDGKAEYNGGTLIVNGEEVDSISGQFGGGFGGGQGGPGGQRPEGGLGTSPDGVPGEMPGGEGEGSN